jgi:PIN domain nuclease of toxin-antitoxin system
MRILLDSHIFLWWVAGERRLPAKVRKVIGSSRNECFLSHASVWEMAIKSALGKLRLPTTVGKFVSEQCEINGFTLLPLSLEHIVAVERLPMHHRDPFDRLLVAQAHIEDMMLATRDRTLKAYGIKVI